jgi:hypothetical protein
MAVFSTKQQTRRLAAERRKFMRTAGGMAVGLGLLADATQAFGEGSGGITQGDAAVLRFLAAAEIIETDLWLQYAELGGTQDNQLPGLPTSGSSAYTAALANLDPDMPQYIHDNTRDELKQVEQSLKLLAVGLGSARHFAEHLLAFGLRQFPHLRVKALAVRRDPCVSINHALLMAVTYAKEKPFNINAPKTLHQSCFTVRRSNRQGVDGASPLR